VYPYPTLVLSPLGCGVGSRLPSAPAPVSLFTGCAARLHLLVSAGSGSSVIVGVYVRNGWLLGRCLHPETARCRSIARSAHTGGTLNCSPCGPGSAAVAVSAQCPAGGQGWNPRSEVVHFRTAAGSLRTHAPIAGAVLMLALGGGRLHCGSRRGASSSTVSSRSCSLQR
jgi:hypothetical protein